MGKKTKMQREAMKYYKHILRPFVYGRLSSEGRWEVKFPHTKEWSRLYDPAMMYWREVSELEVLVVCGPQGVKNEPT